MSRLLRTLLIGGFTAAATSLVLRFIDLSGLPLGAIAVAALAASTGTAVLGMQPGPAA